MSCVLQLRGAQGADAGSDEHVDAAGRDNNNGGHLDPSPSGSQSSFTDPSEILAFQRHYSAPAAQAASGVGCRFLGSLGHNANVEFGDDGSNNDRHRSGKRCMFDEPLGELDDDCKSEPTGRGYDKGSLGFPRSAQSGILARRFGRFQSKSLNIDTSATASSTRTGSNPVLVSHGLPQQKIFELDASIPCRPLFYRCSGTHEALSPGGSRFSDIYEESGEALGKGAFSVVVAGRRKEGGEKVALKILLSAEEGEQQTAMKEWRILSELRHSNVVTAYGLFTAPHRVVLVLELVSGVSLQKALEASSTGRLSEGTGWHLGKCLLEAVAYIHAKGVVHRDIKSTNVMVDLSKPVLHLIDFNCARRLPEKDDGSCTPFCGTKRWAAPEVLLDLTSSISAANDVWAVGLILHLMLLGSLPSAQLGVKKQVQLEGLRRVNVSRTCKDVVQMCLEVDFTKRRSAAMLLTSPWLRAEPGTAP